ncbi:MAG: LamG domain-containing protein [Candidatus Methanoperedens sp.]|nr:LamG domain-containing protein [Candidatus Methanoperedens sp.]
MIKSNIFEKLIFKKIGLPRVIFGLFLMLSIYIPTAHAGYPWISFFDPTPDDGATITQNFVNINTTITDPSETTAFIDWNRSLVGWWKFNGEEGENSAFFRDWSSWGNNATCSGINCPGATTGKFGNALSFDGINDRISNSSSTVLNFTNNVDYSVSAWMQTTGASYPKGDSALAGRWLGFRGWMVYFPNNDGAVSIYADANRFQSANGVYPNDGAWHHIVGIKDGSTGYVYIDGIMKGSGSIGQSSISGLSATFDIGTYAGGAGEIFNGKIDDVQIYNRVLSQEEIYASYNAGIHRLYRNFTNLANGVYSYTAYAQNLSGIMNQTEKRTLTIRSYKLESYNDSSHNNIDNDFGPDEHTVFMHGTGFNAGYGYKVAYYDGINNKTFTETLNADSNGNLSSNRTFVPGVDQEGTWNVQVFNSSYDPPTEYEPGNSNSIVGDSFNVQDAAIPEFPAGIAVPFAVSLILFVYMKNRNGKK